MKECLSATFGLKSFDVIVGCCGEAKDLGLALRDAKVWSNAAKRIQHKRLPTHSQAKFVYPLTFVVYPDVFILSRWKSKDFQFQILIFFCMNKIK